MAPTMMLRLASEPPNHGEESALLRLPLELRRLIILEVFKHGWVSPDSMASSSRSSRKRNRDRREEPLLSKRVLGGRIRLRNRFDDKYPAETNIYVCRRDYIHANALLQTSRQLRQETLDLVENTLKTGKVDIPFVLDLMVIKDVGLLPTWLSCPYRPDHIKKLKVNVRVFRPDKDIIPENWISAAQYKGRDYDYEITVCQWNFLVVLLFYAMGRLTSSSDNTVREQPVTELARNIDKLSPKSHPPGVDVYVSAKAPYTVDELSIEVQPHEHYADSKLVLPYVEDWHKSSLWYKEGHYNFGRTMYTDDRPEDDDDGIIEPLLKAGTLGTGQVCTGIELALLHLVDNARDSEPWHTKYGYITMHIYLDAVVRNIKSVKVRYKERLETLVGGTGDWECQLGWYFESDDIIKAFKKEKRKKEPNEHILHWFRLVKRRMDLGWWDDDEYKKGWHDRNPNGWIDY